MPRRTTIVRGVTPILVALLGAATLTACSSGTDKAADDNTITVYSGRNEQLVGPLLDAFTKATGITVEARYGNSAELAAQLIEEGDRTPADVFFSQDAGALGAVANDDLLGVLPAEAIADVPADYRADDGLWSGVTARARVIAYDSEKYDAGEVPDSVFDVTDPRFRGQVAIAPTNASFQSFVTGMRKSEGDDAARRWLDDLKANDPKIYENNVLILEAVDKGQVGLGLINHYYWYERADEVGAENLRAQLSFTAPGDPGSLVNVAGVGITSSSVDDPDARAFVEYLLGKAAQADLVDRTKEYPVIPGVEVPAGLPPLTSLKGPDVELADLEDLPGTLTMLRETGLL
jgi:iron(III) transport system substrate-binding protein